MPTFLSRLPEQFEKPAVTQISVLSDKSNCLPGAFWDSV